jgi:hypothetical protein
MLTKGKNKMANSKTAETLRPNKLPYKDTGFSKRLMDACIRSPHVPTGEDGNSRPGTKVWIRDQLKFRFGRDVTKVAIGRWFQGTATPRPEILKELAELLQVDEGWLAVGSTPLANTPQEKRKIAISEDGAVNYVAGAIQLSGGSVEFPKTNDPGVDMYAIINNSRYVIQVKRAIPDEGGIAKIALSPEYQDKIVIALFDSKTPFSYYLVRIPSGVIKADGQLRGDYIELSIQANLHNETYTVNRQRLPHIVSIFDLNGVVPDRRVSNRLT